MSPVASRGDQPSLRERNRRATRNALADAALRLAMRHGLEAVRIDDIARLAGVSLRTFRNHFSSKYEALSARHAERMRFAATALRDRPSDEPLWTAISKAVLAPWTNGEAGTALSHAAIAELRLLFGSRQLQAQIMTDALAADNDFARAVSDRLGLDPNTTIYPRLVAASATAVTQVAIDTFLRADPPVAQLPIISDALAQLSQGLPPPPSTGMARVSA